MSSLFIVQTPASGLAAAIAETSRLKGLSWAAARDEVAAQAGLTAADVRAVENGELPDLSIVQRFDSALGAVQRQGVAPSLGYRARATIDRAAAGEGYLFTMSTPDVDRAGDIVGGDWRLTGFLANPVGFWNHGTWGLPIGRWVGVGGNPLTGRFIPYTPAEGVEHPLAVTVGDMLAQGFVHACSVGFYPLSAAPRASLSMDDPRWGKSGMVFHSPELLECSPVGIPMNAQACRPPTDERPAQRSTHNIPWIG